MKSSSILFSSTRSDLSKYLRKGLNTIVIDLDETILYRDGRLIESILYYITLNHIGNPHKDAAESVRCLSEKFQFVALSARWDRVHDTTVQWLNLHNFGSMPVLLSPRLHPFDESRIQFKSHSVSLLHDAGFNPIIGIGDRPSDMAAYAQNGLRCFMVAHNKNSEGNATQVVEKLRSMEQKLRDGVVPLGNRLNSVEELDVTYFSDDPVVHRSFSHDYNLHLPCKPNENGKMISGCENYPDVVPTVWKQIKDVLI